MVRLTCVVALACGCGRVNFDAHADAGLVDAELVDAALDAPIGAHSYLTFDRLAPAAGLDQVPVPITLDDTRADRGLMRSDGADIRFRSADGSLLPHDFERIAGPGGPSIVAWVEVPHIEGLATQIRVEYGDGAVIVPLAMWNTYEAVWHMAGSGTVIDATTNDHDGTAVGTSNIAGIVAGARELDISVPGNIKVTSALGPLSSMTISGWIKFHGGTRGSQFYSIVTRQFGSSNGDDFNLGVNLSGAMPVEFGGLTAGGGGAGYNGPMMTTERWYHEALVYNGTSMTLLLDGVPQVMMPHSGTVAQSAHPVFIGSGHNATVAPFDVADSDFVDGALDEIRIERIARTPARIAFEVAAMRDTVITYGPVIPGIP